MTFITLLLVKGNTLTLSQLHYREVEHMLRTQQFASLPERPIGRHLDGGYCAIDLNSKVIINAQECFDISGIPGLKEFLIYHLSI